MGAIETPVPDRFSEVREDWMVVRAVIYEPVSNPNLPDKWPFAGYLLELVPVVGKCAEIRCVNSMAYKRIP
jgi:hypothetical protein